MDRRRFLKVTAVTGTSAALASCGHPENQIIRFIPDEDIVPGVAVWKPSICPLCSAGCGLYVRVMDADVDVVREGQRGVVRAAVAKKLEGLAEHPVNRGALCARGQAAIQVTYHPDRLRHPMKRTGARGSGQYQEITWDEALDELTARLDALAEARRTHALAYLTKPRTSARNDLIASFLARFGAPPPVRVSLLDEDVLRRANALSFGPAQLPTVDLAHSRFVIAFGADFLGTWNSPVAHGAGYGAMRQGTRGVRGTVVQVESRMSQTGANADVWLPAHPGTEGALALGLAHVIMRDGLAKGAAAGRAGALVESWADGLSRFGPADVERLTGVPAARIEDLARSFAQSPRAVAIVGGPALAHTNALAQAVAVNALNALVGSVGVPGGIQFTPPLTPTLSPRRGERELFGEGATGRASPPERALAGEGRGGLREREAGPRLTPSPPLGGEGWGEGAPTRRSVATIAAEILAADTSPIDVALVDDANPVFLSPSAWRVRDALERIPFIASFGSFLDETSILADLILPDHSFLESWVDVVPESGATVAVAGVAPAAMRPLHATRSTPDVLLDVSRRLRQPLSPPLPWQRFEEMLQERFAALPVGPDDKDAWTSAQQRGGWWSPLTRQSEGTALAVPRGGTPEGVPSIASRRTPEGAPSIASGGSARQAPIAWAEPQFDGAVDAYPFHLLPYASAAFYDGSTAHLPWLQEMPDPMTSAMWSNWIEINPRTAERLQLSTHDIVEIASSSGAVRAPVVITPGIAPDVVAMPLGQGHEAFTRYASNRGSNPISILAPVMEPHAGGLAWAATRVTLTRVGEGRGELILFAGSDVEHPHQHR